MDYQYDPLSPANVGAIGEEIAISIANRAQFSVTKPSDQFYQHFDFVASYAGHPDNYVQVKTTKCYPTLYFPLRKDSAQGLIHTYREFSDQMESERGPRFTIILIGLQTKKNGAVAYSFDFKYIEDLLMDVSKIDHNGFEYGIDLVRGQSKDLIRNKPLSSEEKLIAKVFLSGANRNLSLDI